jgi:hypothetical protein
VYYVIKKECWHAAITGHKQHAKDQIVALLGKLKHYLPLPPPEKTLKNHKLHTNYKQHTLKIYRDVKQTDKK